MRLLPHLIAVLIIQGLALSLSEDVEVIEAVSGQEDHRDGDHHGIQDREDNEIQSSDQLALESGDQDNIPPPPNHAFNGPPHPNRGHPLGLARVPNGHHAVPPPHILLKHNNQPIYDQNSLDLGKYLGPPPPPPPPKQQKVQEAMDKAYIGGNEIWPAPAPDMPKIISLDTQCRSNSMKIFLSFDKPFNGIVFSKGHYSNHNCVHLPGGLGKKSINFEISIHACGTTGNTENGLYGYGAESGSGTYYENTIVIQYDPQVQEVWDQARKLRCIWHDQYEKSVTFRPFPVDMLDVVRADFAGDNVGCWMQIQVGKGPWASEVSGLVKIGQTMTMVLAIKDDDSKFDMLVRNCMAHDGKRAPIELVDQRGCVTRPKLMSRFTKIKNFGASASVLSYAHFQAFKFPDSMEVHFQCTIQICRYQCPDQCSDNGLLPGPPEIRGPRPEYGSPLSPPFPPEIFLRGAPGHPRDERRVRRTREVNPKKEIGLNKVIRVVFKEDLSFALNDNSSSNAVETVIFPAKEEMPPGGMICMTTPGFAATLIVLLAICLVSCLTSAFYYIRLRPFTNEKNVAVTFNDAESKKKRSKTCLFY